MNEPAPGVTPREEDLPDIISVDDHVIEPPDLWQRELPASMRPQGPRVARERVKMAFSGGRMLVERGGPHDGDRALQDADTHGIDPAIWEQELAVRLDVVESGAYAARDCSEAMAAMRQALAERRKP